MLWTLRKWKGSGPVRKLKNGDDGDGDNDDSDDDDCDDNRDIHKN